MPGWTYDTATCSYKLVVEDGTYHVVQAVDGTWRAFFVPTSLGRYTTDEEAIRTVERLLAHRPEKPD